MILADLLQSLFEVGSPPQLRLLRGSGRRHYDKWPQGADVEVFKYQEPGLDPLIPRPVTLLATSTGK